MISSGENSPFCLDVLVKLVPVARPDYSIRPAALFSSQSRQKNPSVADGILPGFSPN